MNGNDLYIANSNAGTIVKVDISGTLPTNTTAEVVNGLASPYSLLLHGNDIYIPEFNGNKISKADISATLPTTAAQVVTADEPFYLLANGD